MYAPISESETVKTAYHFLGRGTAGEGSGGELILHGSQVPVQQIQGGMHSSRIAVIPCLLCIIQLLSQLPGTTQRKVLQQGKCVCVRDRWLRGGGGGGGGGGRRDVVSVSCYDLFAMLGK